MCAHKPERTLPKTPGGLGGQRAVWENTKTSLRKMSPLMKRLCVVQKRLGQIRSFDIFSNPLGSLKEGQHFINY